MNIFALITLPIATTLLPYIAGRIIFRQRVTHVFTKVRNFNIEGVGKARFQVLIPYGYNLSITECHGFGVIEVNVKRNAVFISCERGYSSGGMSRYELPNGTVYWEFVDEDFMELRPHDIIYMWLRVTRADGSEFTVDNLMVPIH